MAFATITISQIPQVEQKNELLSNLSQVADRGSHPRSGRESEPYECHLVLQFDRQL